MLLDGNVSSNSHESSHGSSEFNDSNYVVSSLPNFLSLCLKLQFNAMEDCYCTNLEQPPNIKLISSEIARLDNAKYFASDQIVNYEWTLDATFWLAFVCVCSVDHSEDIPSDEKIGVEVVIHQDGSCITLD